MEILGPNMHEKSYDLADAVVPPPGGPRKEEPSGPRKPRGKYEPGFIVIPVRVRMRLKGASAIARSLAPCVVEMHNLRKLGQPLILTNELAEECGVSRKLKRKALEELTARQIIVLQPKTSAKIHDSNLWQAC